MQWKSAGSSSLASNSVRNESHGSAGRSAGMAGGLGAEGGHDIPVLSQRGPIYADPLGRRRRHGVPTKGGFLEQPRPLEFVNHGRKLRRLDSRRLKDEAQAVLQILKLGLSDQPSPVHLIGIPPDQPGQSFNHPRISVGLR